MPATLLGDWGTPLDYRTFALKRAQSRGVFTSPSTIFEDNGSIAPTVSGSLFQASTISAGGSVAALPGDVGGVWRLTTAGTNNAATTVVAGAGSVGAGVKPGMTGDPATAGSRWYLFAAFRMSTAVDNKTFAYIGIRPADNTTANVLYFGIDGAFVSTTKLMAEENVTNTVTSTVDIGSTSTWHYVEAWQTGTANQVKVAFDSEAPLTLTTTAAFAAKGTPFVAAGNGTTLTARSFDIDHIVVLMPGNVTLPNV